MIIVDSIPEKCTQRKHNVHNSPEKNAHREHDANTLFQIKICISWTSFSRENEGYLSPLIMEDTSTQMYQEFLK